EHLALLKAVTCDEGQGYYLSGPVEAAAFSRMIESTLVE
ncbi:MAG: hypothetical protein K0S85_1233, partial [Pseudomonas orientalis]|nr:hypothetical protein [Pseudomonas orientalis]